jgi:hypothetical protein
VHQFVFAQFRRSRVGFLEPVEEAHVRMRRGSYARAPIFPIDLSTIAARIADVLIGSW